MTEEPIIPPESAIIGPVSEETTDLVKAEMPEASEDVIKETAELFEAIKKRVLLELETARDLTNEAYQKAVAQAEEALETNKTVAKERLEDAVRLLNVEEVVTRVQEEAHKNWLVLDAIRTRAQAQVQEAGDMTRENYLKAVREAKTAVAQNQLIDRDRIEQAAEQLQKEAEKNWLVIVSEIEAIGVRLADTAKNAWNALLAFFGKSEH
ncbi:MAG: hypothetical protein ACM37W_18655 [Actinomycetota bacterium]